MNTLSRDTTAADVDRSHRIDVELRNMRQLFNSMDRSAFHEKDLDREAEEFIVSPSEEYPPGAPLTDWSRACVPGRNQSLSELT